MPTRITRILTLTAALLFHSLGYGATYYVDSVSGLDANAGTSEVAAFQTLAAVEAVLTDGDTINLKRGSYWREQLDIVETNVTIGVYGTGAMPVIDGADIVTTGWTQPDAVTYPNVWSRSWSRAAASTTGSEVTGFWQAEARTTRRTSLTLLQAGSNGDWHTTSINDQNSTISVRAAANPNTDGILREITKRAYAINSHSQIVGSAITGLTITGPIEAKRCYGHYNALTMGGGEGSRMFLRDGNIHHSVAEGNLTDIVLEGYSPDVSASLVACYRSASTGFAPVLTRNVVILPGGTSRPSQASAFFAHGGTGYIDSFDVLGCLTKGASFANAESEHLTVTGGYCEDAQSNVISCSSTLNSISYLWSRETTASPLGGGPSCFFTGGSTTTDTDVSHSCFHMITSGTGGNQFNSTHQHHYDHCAFVMAASGQPFAGGAPDIRYTVCQGARSYHNFGAGYTGDYNVFYFITLANPQFQVGGNVYGTLAALQAGTSQDANSVYLKHADQVSGNGIAFWLGISSGVNNGPADGDWRINPSARVYNGAGTQLTGTFADGTTPITEAGPQGHWDFNTRSVVAGPPTEPPVFPNTIAKMRAYLEDPEAWDLYVDGGGFVFIGDITTSNLAARSVTLTSTAATGGTAPLTYQWYRDTTPGFTPSGSNDIPGATSLTLNDTGLSPETTYYYILRVTDDNAETDDSAEVEVTTLESTRSPAVDGGGFFGPGRFNYQIPDAELDSLRITLQPADRRRNYAIAL